MDNQEIDYKKKLEELAEERKKIKQAIFELRDKVLEECDKVLGKHQVNNEQCII